MAQNIDILITAKDNASKQIDSAKKSIIDLKWSVAQMWGVTSTVFAWLKTWAIALWWAIAGLWAFGVKAWADMEQVNIAFKTLYGSSEQAKKTLESLADFAAKTPFEFPELADSALKLQNIAGISKDQLIPTLTSLGDIAASQGKWIDQITEAFNDAIVWEFERLKEFGIRATQEGDKVTFSYKWQTTVVQKNNEAIADYISKLWQAQGVAWAMDAQSNTLNWRISTMKDNFSFLVMEIVWVTKSWEIVKDGFFDKISKAINSLASFMETYKPQIIWFFQSIWDTAEYIAQIGIEWWNEYGTEIKELGKTIQQIFEKDWPIAMGVLLESFKAWLELLWVAIKGINIIFRGEFLETMYAGFEELWFFISNKFDEFVQWFKDFANEMYQEAKMFATNFMGMMGDGITEWIGDLKNKAAEAAWILSDYLWFHSPTKKWPWSDADKWMPNLMKMLATWIDSWEATIRQSAVRVASAIWQTFSVKQFEWFTKKVAEIQSTVKSAFDNLNGNISSNKWKILWLKDEYNSLKEKLKEIWDEGKKEIDKISQAITDQQEKIAWIQTWGKWEVAKRALEIEKELAEIQKWMQQEWADKTALELSQKRLESELALATSAITQEELSKAREESEKSITQTILERFEKQKSEAEIELANLNATKDAKLLAIELEKTAQKALIAEKKLEIESEYELYKSLLEQRKTLDNEYFTLFGMRIKRQMDETKQAIALLQQYNSVAGGWNISGSAWEVYKMQTASVAPVWWSSNISINMGWMTVNNRSDADYLIDKMKTVMIRELQLSKLGIS